MVRVFKLIIFTFFISNFSFAENPVLRDEAQKILKRNRINSNAALKEWTEKAKDSVKTKVEELQKNELSPVLAASADIALASLKDETFRTQVLDTLKKVNRIDWEEVLKDLAALMKQKNLKIEDIVQNPEIINSFIAAVSEKEKAFWEARSKESAQIPLTENSPALSLPSGSLEDGLKLMRALSLFVKIEVSQPCSNNLLIRAFVTP